MAAVVAMTAAALVSCGDDPRAGRPTITSGDLTISDAFVGSFGGQVVAGYLTIENHGPSDRLIAITSPDADRVGHMGAMRDGGSIETTSREPIAIPADGLLEFRPGGAHLMIDGLQKPLAPDDAIRLRLTFDKAPPVDVTATAVDVADIPDLLDRHD